MNEIEPPSPEDAEALESEHRDLDALLGEFLGAASSGALAEAVDTIARFDDALRVHTSSEEGVFPEAPAKLVEIPGETGAAAFFRERRLEHVQIRELSAMIRRVLGESADLSGARSLAAGLATRWEAHTEREEKEWLKR
jgi:hypothetical protein